MKKENDFPPQQELPFLQHLIELRDRLLRVVLVVLVIFLALFGFANDLYSFLAEPLLKQLPQGSTMIATGVISPFLTPFKLSLVASIFIAIPFILYQAWGFIAPALYKKEKRLVFPLLLSSTLLFYLGMVFAYYVVFPLVFGFMATTTPDGVAQAPDITLYLDFSLKLFFAFGMAFEVPIATILVIWTGLTTAESLAKKRPYIIVGAFFIGMLLTPPDIISQTLLAIPMWILFELGLLFSKMYSKPESDEDDDEIEDSVTSVGAAATASASSEEESASSEEESASNEEEDDSVAMHYSEDESDHVPMTDDELDAELDSIEEDEDLYDNADEEGHQEYEPFPEEQESEEQEPEEQDSDSKNPDEDSNPKQ